METIRAFIAIPLPHPLLEKLAALQRQLEKQIPPGSVRWTRAEGIHLTLKFLGDVPTAQQRDIEQGMAQASGHHPFTLNAGGLGCFPNFKRPRVVWVGLGGQMDALHALRDTVERAIAPLGYPTEKRRFNPHLTLGRVKKHASKADVVDLGQRLEATEVDALGQNTVTGISLIRSQLRPSGAVYTQLSHVKLEGADE